MEYTILIKSLGDPNLPNLQDKFIVKDVVSGKIYIGDNSNTPNEIKTDKSNNWAKTFFYGGD